MFMLTRLHWVVADLLDEIDNIDNPDEEDDLEDVDMDEEEVCPCCFYFLNYF
jgi:hypothetical protein